MASRMCRSGYGLVGRGAVAAVLFLALAFTAGGASGGDNAAFVSYSGVPMTMEPGQKATVTVTMRNTGTTTWKATIVKETTQGTRTTTHTSFHLNAVSDVWGVSGEAVAGSAAPNAPYGFSFEITAPAREGSYPFQWRMARRTIVVEIPTVPASPDGGFGATTPRKMIVVKEKPKPPPDTAPSFGAPVPNQVWPLNKAIKPLTLPEATGGNGALRYSFFGCGLPGGVRRAGRRISGTPTTVKVVTCTWKVTDSDSNTAESDSDKLTFRITVPGLILSKTNLSVKENGAEKFTVKLATRPTGNVSVSVRSDDRGAADVNKGSLTFTTHNYSRAQTLTVKGVEDLDASPESTTVRLTASGGGYAGVSAQVGVTVTDDDEPIIVVDPSSLTIVEGKSGTFKVKLAAQPTGTDEVRVRLSVPSLDADKVSVDKATLTLTTADYGTPQTVTVTGKKAHKDAVTINLTGSGGDYGGLTAKVKVTVTPPPVVIASRTSLEVKEGESASFTVKLGTQPTHEVTVSVESDAPGVATVKSSASLTFTPTDYGTTQTVTVTGEKEGKATIDLTASGGNYEDKSAEVEVKVTAGNKPEPPEIVVNPAPPAVLTVAEGGSSPFTVKLATQPTGRVTVRLSVPSRDSGKVTLNKTSLAFSTTDYATTKTVWVSGDEDDDFFNESATVNLRASGGDYGGVSASVDVAVTDDDEPARQDLVVSTRSVKVREGESETFTVKLATRPTATVTVSLKSGDAGAATASPPKLTFTAGNYGTTQTVTVKGEQDADASDERTTIGLTASGGDYGAVADSVTVTVDDDDGPGLVVSGTPLLVEEEGDAGSFTVKLATAPTAAVSVSVSVPGVDAEEVAVKPSRLAFTATDYGAPKTVQVTGRRDADALVEEAKVVLRASGGDYGGESASVDVVVKDDDESDLLVSRSSVEFDEGGSGEFAVALAAAPLEKVTVVVRSRDARVATVSPERLTFETTDYGTLKTVTVTGGEADADARDELTTVELLASGYGGATATLDVVVKDTDVRGLVLSRAKLEVVEEGEGKAFTVKLRRPCPRA